MNSGLTIWPPAYYIIRVQKGATGVVANGYGAPSSLAQQLVREACLHRQSRGSPGEISDVSLPCQHVSLCPATIRIFMTPLRPTSNVRNQLDQLECALRSLWRGSRVAVGTVRLTQSRGHAAGRCIGGRAALRSNCW